MRRYYGLTCLVCLMLVVGIAETVRAVDDLRMQRLQSGEVLLEPSSLGKKTQQATILIHATPEKLLQALIDYELFFRIFPDNAGAEVRNKGEGWDEICFKMHRVITFDYCLHRTIDLKQRWIYLTLLKGNFQEMKGYWQFSPTVDGQATIASFSILVEVSWLPDRLTRGGNRKGMISTVQALRDWAENGVFAGEQVEK